LSAARSGNGFCFEPIKFSEIDAWARVTGAKPSPWEVSLLRQIDVVIVRKLNSKQSGKEISASDVDSVDAMFDRLEAKANKAFK
jgi:hypothetical protein